jgi:predicted glycosyltransferase
MKKIVIYGHDSFGLGHVNRIINIANKLSENKKNRIIIITGSKGLSLFKVDNSIDVVKIPCIVSSFGTGKKGGYFADIGDDCNEAVFNIRKKIILNVIKIFKPDIFLVDHNPVGPNLEILEVLEFLKNSSKKTKIYLGQRDLLYEKNRYIKNCKKNNLFHIIEKFYDKVFIYGQKNVFNFLDFYKIPEKIKYKYFYLGYIVNPNKNKKFKKDKKRSILVLSGGGRDGALLMERCLDVILDIQKIIDINFTLNLGPLMSKGDIKKIIEKNKKHKNVKIKEYLYNTREYILKSDLVISMGGYNSVCEILSTSTPAIIYPRIDTDKEQLIRAKIFKSRSLLDYIDPKNYNRTDFLKKIFKNINKDKNDLNKRRSLIKFDGLNNLTKIINE